MVSTFTAIYPGGEEYVGKGVAPDVEVHPTRKEIFEGKDLILAKGIEVIRNWKSHTTQSGAGVD
jgi:C-terminal processing protease CtpA/Prc